MATKTKVKLTPAHVEILRRVKDQNFTFEDLYIEMDSILAAINYEMPKAEKSKLLKSGETKYYIKPLEDTGYLKYYKEFDAFEITPEGEAFLNGGSTAG